MSLEQDVRVLSQIPLLAQLDAEALRLLAFAGEKMTLAKDQHLYRGDQASDCGYVLLSGTVLVGTSLESHPDHLVIAPALVGETAMMVETKRPGDAVAMDAATLLKIPRTLFLRVMREFPEGSDRLRMFIGQRLIGFARELEMARLKADSRVL